KGGAPLSAKEVIDMADAVDVILQRGAESQEVMTQQARTVMSAMTSDSELKGFFKDPREAIALTATASSFAGGQAADATIEATRALRGFTKFRKIKGLPASQAQTLAAAGITEQQTPTEAMMTLFKFADKEMKPDEAFDTFLARRGFRDQTGNMRLAQFYGQYKRGSLQDILGMAAGPVSEGEAGRKAAAFQATPYGRMLLEKARRDEARVNQGKSGRELSIGMEAGGTALEGAGAERNPMYQLARTWMGRLTGGMVTKEVIAENVGVKQAQIQAGQAPSALGFTPMTLVFDFLKTAFTDNTAEMNRLRKAVEDNTAARGAQQGVGPAPAAMPIARPAPINQRP